MIKNNQFVLNTKFGPVGVKITGVNFFYISNRLDKESGYGEEDLPPVVIRNKTYHYFSGHWAVNEGNNRLIEIQTYDFNGNTPCFPSKHPGNRYFQIKNFYSSQMTEAAKYAMVIEITEKLNKFYQENLIQILDIWAKIRKESRIKEMEKLQEEIDNLTRQIAEKSAELNRLNSIVNPRDYSREPNGDRVEEI